MNPVEIIHTIKRMLNDKITTSERERLINGKPMVNYQTQQWEKSPKAHIEDNTDSQKILDKITGNCWNRAQPSPKNKKYYRIGYSIAATAAIFIIGLWVANSLSSSYINVSSPTNEKLAVILPDSSEIWLNTASQIRYRKSFQDNREIFLEKGEAFFKVKKHHGAPFRVYFQGSRIEVTGTEFNIKSGKTESEITLFSGAIKFRAENNQEELPMKPSERIVYNTNAKSIVRTNIDTGEYDWRSDKYRFTNKPLLEFIEFINRTYQVHIIIDGKKPKELKFNGIIHKGEPLADILEKLCISLDLNKRQDKDNIILY